MVRYRTIEPCYKRHIFCSFPITLDKSRSWGPGNVQTHPNGSWIQIGELGCVSHLVDDDNGNPRGWTLHDRQDDMYKKNDVYAIYINDVSKLGIIYTKDGPINYDPNNYPNGGYLTYNLRGNTKIDEDDPWLIEKDKFEKIYERVVDKD